MKSDILSRVSRATSKSRNEKINLVEQKSTTANMLLLILRQTQVVER